MRVLGGDRQAGVQVEAIETRSTDADLELRTDLDLELALGFVEVAVERVAERVWHSAARANGRNPRPMLSMVPAASTV
jgi:hypothetical protein